MKYKGTYKSARKFCRKKEITIHEEVFTKGEAHLMVTVPKAIKMGKAEDAPVLQPGLRVLRAPVRLPETSQAAPTAA